MRLSPFPDLASRLLTTCIAPQSAWRVEMAGERLNRRVELPDLIGSRFSKPHAVVRAAARIAVLNGRRPRICCWNRPLTETTGCGQTPNLVRSRLRKPQLPVGALRYPRRARVGRRDDKLPRNAAGRRHARNLIDSGFGDPQVVI